MDSDQIFIAFLQGFYRAMHFSAKRGIAIVILTVCYVHAQ